MIYGIWGTGSRGQSECISVARAEKAQGEYVEDKNREVSEAY